MALASNKSGSHLLYWKHKAKFLWIRVKKPFDKWTLYSRTCLSIKADGTDNVYYLGYVCGGFRSVQYTKAISLCLLTD